ncbi:MAG TPA: ferredoxin [Bacteroidales bacterium]|nr:ferredoxin [Bacteroidales bacterium]
MAEKYFHHALKFRREVCIGCSHCMNVCPTQAIRIHSGKAELTDNRCVDCGKCYMACPVGAIIVEQDDFSQIFMYRHRIALIPGVLLGQFPGKVTNMQIYSVLLDMGFTEVEEVEKGTGILRMAMDSYLQENHHLKPLISSFCPAIVRLIQVRFPSLTENIMLLKAPLDVTATYIRKKYAEMGVDPKEVGIYYITPCAAKIAAVKSPVGDKFSQIDGVINMDVIFNKVYTAMKQGFAGKNQCSLPVSAPLKPFQQLWTLTEGEASLFPGRSLAIDEISNVIEFLEKLENEETCDINFLELRACDQSCAGGILASGNRFFTVERLRKTAIETAAKEDTKVVEASNDILNHTQHLLQNMAVSKVLPRAMDKLDEDMKMAMLKMQMVREIMKTLPYVDCGLCGAPTCRALAQDIVQGKAKITNCIFIQKKYEQKNWLNPQETMDILKQVWGDDKFTDPDNTKFVTL